MHMIPSTTNEHIRTMQERKPTCKAEICMEDTPITLKSHVSINNIERLPESRRALCGIYGIYGGHPEPGY